jgi:predicted molibdopterin-dependent oxidoreductase YjgC
VVDPPEELTPAWEQITRVAQLMGAGWSYRSGKEVMQEIGEVVPFYSGVGYENLTREYGRQWPCTRETPLGTKFLFAEGGAERQFKFVPVPYQAPSAAATEEFPLMLVFGNSLYYWNQNVLIRHSETLKREYCVLTLDYPEGFVEFNPEDARDLKVRDGEHVRLCTANSFSVVAARVTSEVMKGIIFVPHFMRDVEREILRTNGNGHKLVPVRVEKEAA